MSAALHEAAEAARRIVAAHEAWERDPPGERVFAKWEGYVGVARDEACEVARALLAMPGTDWRPVLARGDRHS